ncbi:putative immunity/bacteriocin fusion bifunctional protein [Bacillus mycoides]|uniref:putative immunity/bacteriocin fusion bifunctional protein n=1 Tax=Bacillus mycoides TaxID=1405 RepID=UPI003CFE60F3
MFKKIIAVCSSALVLTLGIGANLASANTITPVTPVKECNSCTETLGMSINEAVNKLAKEGTKTNLNVSNQDKKEVKKLVVKKDKEYQNVLQTMKKDGFVVEAKADNYVLFEDLKDQNSNNKNYEKVATYTEFFYNKSSNELARKQVWVDLKTKEVVKYDMFKFKTDGSEDATLLVSYDKKIESAKVETPNKGDGPVMYASKFNFAGMGFACSMSGLIACAAAFGGLEVVMPYLGVATSVGCATAFNYGCSWV